MLQVIRKKKTLLTSLVLILVLTVGLVVRGSYLNTNRDTRPAPESVTSQLEVTNNYELLYETEGYNYYFREDRDVIAIENKKTGYVWKTGIDVPYNDQIEDAKEAVLDSEAENDPNILKDYAEDNDMTVKEVKELANTPQEDSLTGPYLEMANSLLTVEYYKGSGESMTLSRVSSAAEDDDDGTSGISKVEADGSKWVLKCLLDVDGEEVGINLYITFTEDGKINYNVPFEEITGETVNKISNISISPYLGAAGGAVKYYDPKEEDWEKLELKEMVPGYVLVPDGSGALIRFTENNTEFTDYEGKVYGIDPSTEVNYYDSLDDAVPVKNPVMPVFGVSHGDGTQDAFVAYADSGDEYMSIVVNPSSTNGSDFKYTYAYAAFQYNTDYFQMTNQSGDGYRKLQDDMNVFDIDLTYQFLSGDGSDGTPSADYVGMAQAYREHLIEVGILSEVESDDTDIPIRIDFLMADSKKGVFSTQEVVVTTTDDVNNILTTLQGDGITNINSGLIGWQDGGETLSKPYDASFSSSIGSEGDFEELMASNKDKGIDISFSREFVTINEDMINYYGNSAKHLSTQYLNVNMSAILPENVPVAEFGYADPNMSAEWMTELYGDVGGYSPSFTIDGVSNILLSTYSNDGDNTTVTETIGLYQDTISQISEDGTKINLVAPNMYLWQYTDRYLQSPVGTSQYVYETDTVPFLQMVLNGTMEVYAPYSNFSFYSQKDMLRIVDYNISPSFVLTQEPSYLLASTTSSDYYSTEFAQYEELVKTIYNTVNEPLSQVINYTWVDRTVLQDGVIANEYEKDGNVKTIIINYTEDEVTVNGVAVAALSTAVLEGGVK